MCIIKLEERRIRVLYRSVGAIVKHESAWNRGIGQYGCLAGNMDVWRGYVKQMLRPA